MGGVVVNAGLVSRPVEFRAMSEFLRSAAERTSGFVIEGEAGIGKTTLWLTAQDEARARGFEVLSARVGETESVLAYAAIADLLGDVDPAILGRLPPVQRLAVDRVLLRASTEGPETDQRVVAAAFAAAIEHVAAEKPLLVAIDNVQWLDWSSQAVVAFAARRFRGRVGVLATERCDPDCGKATSWLHLARPDGVRRVRVGPLSLGGLHALVSARLGRSFSRPTMVRVAEISGGNPFYALELARAIHIGSGRAQPSLPGTLAELMRLRIGSLEGQAGEVLLAAASVANPTVELLAQVIGTTEEHAIDLLDEAEIKGIVAIDGNRVRFSHPLLARSVYTDASPARRRAMHRVLSDVVVMPELKARHMALAAARADSETLKALDDAADAARARGAPAAAAELVELAISLGGDKPSRRIRAGEHHFKAGDADRARSLLESTIDELRPGLLRGIALNLLAGIHIYDDTFVEGAALLSRALDDADANPALKVQTLMSLAFAQGMSGEFDDSLSNARQAVAHAEQLGYPPLISRALAMLVNTSFLYGHGVDETNLRRALELEDPDSDTPIPFCASAVNALIYAWTGQLNIANRQMAAVRDRCVERGAENDMMAVTGYCTLIEMWRGNFAAAAVLADDTMERAEQVGGSRTIALTVRAAVAAYTGREREARADAAAALAIARECRSPRLAEWPTMSLGFLAVSLGDYPQALTSLQPMLDVFDALPGSEIMTATFIPDAVEAMIGVGRHADAVPLIEELEQNGALLGRSWMIAVGARCRSMWLAATGDVAAATRMAEDAMTEHERLPMPFERARTLLLLGQLQRRQRRKESAAATLREALEAFEAMGTPLWADRARAELARTNVAPRHDRGLTPSERRVAELAASGMTNRDVASALFISPKTVEANLVRIYRKLGIKTRAELGRLIGNL
ncbi:AAA family ATPase [Mycobacterium sp.]|jgi:DNA-binding CsgD family transcriptional regulator|uniref:ATP-binding protein n=1 Tax=Mycobacterium sp. TaxID=1785 RepID=UPI003341A5F5